MGNPDLDLSSNVLRRGLQDEVISATPQALARLRGYGADLLSATMANVAAEWEKKIEKSPWLGQQSSWQLPQTRRYHQSRFPTTVPAVQPDPALDWMIELARFPVPYGSVGIIKSFEQFVSQGETVYTTSPYWGNPFPLSLDIRWFFRLSAVHLVATRWINATGFSAIPEYLPGIPYDDFSRTDDLWFPSGSSSSANIHLPIPGGKVLRIVCLVGSSQTAVNVAAKVAGTIQTELTRDAQFALRTSW